MKKIIIILILLITVSSNAGFKDDIEKCLICKRPLLTCSVEIQRKSFNRFLTHKLSQTVESLKNDSLKEMLYYSIKTLTDVQHYILQYRDKEITYNECQSAINDKRSLLEMQYLKLKVKQRINK